MGGLWDIFRVNIMNAPLVISVLLNFLQVRLVWFVNTPSVNAHLNIIKLLLCGYE